MKTLAKALSSIALLAGAVASMPARVKVVVA